MRYFEDLPCGFVLPFSLVRRVLGCRSVAIFTLVSGFLFSMSWSGIDVWMSTLAEKEKLERGGSRERAQLTVLHLISKLEEHVFEIIEAIRRRFSVPVGSDGRHCCGSCVSGVVELKLWRYEVGSEVYVRAKSLNFVFVRDMQMQPSLPTCKISIILFVLSCHSR